jgi:hypothetical protein
MLAEPLRVGKICELLAQMYGPESEIMIRDGTVSPQALVECCLVRETDSRGPQ